MKRRNIHNDSIDKFAEVSYDTVEATSDASFSEDEYINELISVCYGHLEQEYESPMDWVRDVEGEVVDGVLQIHVDTYLYGIDVNIDVDDLHFDEAHFDDDVIMVTERIFDKLYY